MTYYHTYGVPLGKSPIHALRCILILRLRLRLRLDLAKYLFNDEIQAASLHPPLGQIVKFLRLPDGRLILPAANLPFPEKFVELLNILQPAERRLLHLLKPDLPHHLVKPLPHHSNVQKLRNSSDLARGIPLHVFKRQEQDIAFPCLLPTCAPPTQHMLEPIPSLHLPAAKHSQPQLPARLEEPAIDKGDAHRTLKQAVEVFEIYLLQMTLGNFE